MKRSLEEEAFDALNDAAFDLNIALVHKAAPEIIEAYRAKMEAVLDRYWVAHEEAAAEARADRLDAALGGI